MRLASCALAPGTRSFVPGITAPAGVVAVAPGVPAAPDLVAPGVVVAGAPLRGVVVPSDEPPAAPLPSEDVAPGVPAPGVRAPGVVAPGVVAPGVALVGVVTVLVIVLAGVVRGPPASLTSDAVSAPSATTIASPSAISGVRQLGVEARRVRAAAPHRRHHSCSGRSGVPHSGHPSPASGGGPPSGWVAGVWGAPAGAGDPVALAALTALTPALTARPAARRLRDG